MAKQSELTERRRRDAIRRRIRRPPGHWGLLAFCIGAMLVLLLVQGFSVRTTGRSGTPAGPVAHAPLAGSPPLLAGASGRLVAREQPAGRRIALTFDDGPDPRWTPRIAATLKRLGVPATFFVIGSEAVRHPDVVRMLHRDGFELGNHTFTHSDLAALPHWERSLQLGLTESALAGIVGVRARLLRPPYSSEPNAVTPKQARALNDVAGDGYVVVLADFDGEDWRRPGVSEIARAITPKGRTGGVILLHDGGGNRSETVAALNRVVPPLKARGFKFVRVSDLAGIPQSAAEPPATRSEKLRGGLLVATLAVARSITAAATVALFAIAILVLLRTVILLALARRHARTTRAVAADSSYTPPVSIVVPAFNERVDIERSVRALAASDYPDFEVVVVDDGSVDGTGEIVESLELERVRLVRQSNLGKPAALNAGIAASRTDLIVTADADTLFEPGSLRRLVQPFRDPRVGAACGNTKVGNRGGLLGRWQHMEYVMGFNLDRRLYDVLRCMPTVPGAIGAFRREALRDIGGISAETLAEDTDATLAVGRAGWRVTYVEDARGWTEAPASVGALWRQRYRWSYGTMQAAWKHRAALWRRGEERIGRRGIPYLVLFQIALPMLAPLVDVFALYGLLFLNPLEVAAYWGGFTALQLLLAVYAFRLDRESLKPLWTMPLQQFAYRQLMYLVVIESAASALRGVQLRWQRSERTGDAEIGSDRPAGARS
jgi:cellulose synthase/poly-beta-1,6-N-acetylglucosamine synthase-like glycosyltransferase/peptidoglycan/xylan/chitin deacetylase (PgdA/CDA1 family)